MTERDKLLASIAELIADYRVGELAPPTPDHVDRWVFQFSSDVQVPLLREMDHVLRTTYFKRKAVVGYLSKLVSNNKLAGANPCDFWKSATPLDIQKHGHSQHETLELFEEILRKECNLTIKECGSVGSPFIYLDDVLFTGGRVGDDLSDWLKTQASSMLTVHVIVIATHTFGAYKMPQRIRKEAAAQGKKIALTIWRYAEFENQFSKRNLSEVLWPAELPEDEGLKAYLAEEQKFPFKPRKPGGKLQRNVFSSEQGRQLLEREFLLAGLRIRSFCNNPSRAMRPLGFSPFGLGFGSMIVTFRNCPNNCPLALWWGDPEEDASSPLSKWYPLFERKTYENEVDFDEIEF